MATFCYRIARGEKPEVLVDNVVQLIPVEDVCRIFIDLIRRGDNTPEIPVPPMAVRKVTEVLHELESFRAQYLERGIAPEQKTPFDRALFNMFRSYIVPGARF